MSAMEAPDVELYVNELKRRASPEYIEQQWQLERDRLVYRVSAQFRREQKTKEFEHRVENVDGAAFLARAIGHEVMHDLRLNPAHEMSLDVKQVSSIVSQGLGYWNMIEGEQ